MTALPTEVVRDECYRCGYDLRGIANDGACPECGLLAERSRRVTDELHDTRPRWLRSLSWGINFILAGIVAMFAGPFLTGFRVHWIPLWWSFYVPFVGFNVAAILLAVGVALVTRAEGYGPADLADRGLRRLLRVVAMVPVPMTGFLIAWELNRLTIRERVGDAVVIGFLFMLAFIPLLLFVHLRGLAKRARSAHLAEHCVIVGVGAFVSIIFLAGITDAVSRPERWGLKTNWQFLSTGSQVMMLALGVACGLFLLWGLYLLVRFAVAFRMAAGKLRRKWNRDDRSLTT